MTRKTLTISLGLLSGLWLGLSLHGWAAPVVPVKPTTAIPAAPSMADLLTGKLFPNTVKRSDLMASYHLISLVDAQGRLTVCATQGTMLTMGGETFLVVYLPPPPPPKSADPAAPAPPAVPPDADAQLTLINMHDVQAIGGIRTVPPAEAPAAPTTPVNPAAPATPTAPAGTATP